MVSPMYLNDYFGADKNATKFSNFSLFPFSINGSYSLDSWSETVWQQTKNKRKKASKVHLNRVRVTIFVHILKRLFKSRAHFKVANNDKIKREKQLSRFSAIERYDVFLVHFHWKTKITGKNFNSLRDYVFCICLHNKSFLFFLFYCFFCSKTKGNASIFEIAPFS